MSLYDDLDTIKTKTTEKVAGWSSGIKLLQSQLQLKKAAKTQPTREQQRKASLAPVIDLKSKSRDDDIYPIIKTTITPKPMPTYENPLPIISSLNNVTSEYDWDVIGEYDPLWPNEYDKVVKEMRDQRERDNDKQDDRDRKRERKKKSRFADNEEPVITSPPQLVVPTLSGFAGRWAEEEEDEEPRIEAKPRPSSGVAIAPPPSLVETVEIPSVASLQASSSYGASSVAAKIMAKYGFKEGQGLGKKEQGMAVALQVEKTSKRGGRIIHEKEMMPPPLLSLSPPSIPLESKSEPTITEIMKSPSKVVLLRNMVGPGEVDEDLEPEVREECNTKYGDVIKVLIHEVPNTTAEEAVRIFVEFKRMESAIKAVVDLNGRFFGGRTVKAGFYDIEKFLTYQLME